MHWWRLQSGQIVWEKEKLFENVYDNEAFFGGN